MEFNTKKQLLFTNQTVPDSLTLEKAIKRNNFNLIKDNLEHLSIQHMILMVDTHKNKMFEYVVNHTDISKNYKKLFSAGLVNSNTFALKMILDSEKSHLQEKPLSKRNPIHLKRFETMIKRLCCDEHLDRIEFFLNSEVNEYIDINKKIESKTAQFSSTILTNLILNQQVETVRFLLTYPKFKKPFDIYENYEEFAWAAGYMAPKYDIFNHQKALDIVNVFLYDRNIQIDNTFFDKLKKICPECDNPRFLEAVEKRNLFLSLNEDLENKEPLKKGLKL